MIEIFKTNVDNQLIALQIINAILLVFPTANANFDLEDCDRILRISSDTNSYQIDKTVVEIIQSKGFAAKVLADEQSQKTNSNNHLFFKDKLRINTVLSFF